MEKFHGTQNDATKDRNVGKHFMVADEENLSKLESKCHQK